MSADSESDEDLAWSCRDAWNCLCSLPGLKKRDDTWYLLLVVARLFIYIGAIFTALLTTSTVRGVALWTGIVLILGEICYRRFLYLQKYDAGSPYDGYGRRAGGT